jgi:tetratricopeptide (TPR) repeat protein
MRAAVAAALACLLLLGSPASAQDPLADANAAYRRGEFRRAAQLFAQAADAESDPNARANIRVKLAWTYWALKERGKAEEALEQALADAPHLELVPEYYTSDFVKALARVRERLSPPRATPTPVPLATQPRAELGSLAALRNRLALAEDAPALESLLGEVRTAALTAAPPVAAELLELEADTLDRLGRVEEALALRGRGAAMRAMSLAAPGANVVPLDALLEARRLLAGGRPQEAAALMNGVLSALPSCVPALEIMAEALLDAGRLDEAYSALRTALLGNEKAELLMNLGEVEVRRNNPNAAREAFRRAVDLDPRNDRAWAATGLLAARLGDTPAARDALDRALALNGTLFEARVARAQLALADGDAAAALQHIQRALQVRPDDPWAAGWAGVVHLAAGNLAAALPRLEAAAAWDPSTFTLALVEALRRQGRAQQGLERLGEPPLEDVEAQLLLGRCLLDLGRAAEAKGALQRVAQIRPGDARVRYLLGLAHHGTRDWEQAVNQIAQAAELPGAPSHIAESLALARATAAGQQLMDAAQEVINPPSRR